MDRSSDVQARAIARRIVQICTDFTEVKLIAVALIRAGADLKRRAPASGGFIEEIGAEMSLLHDGEVK